MDLYFIHKTTHIDKCESKKSNESLMPLPYFPAAISLV